jgi:hypothetical protein
MIVENRKKLKKQLEAEFGNAVGVGVRVGVGPLFNFSQASSLARGWAGSQSPIDPAL